MVCFLYEKCVNVYEKVHIGDCENKDTVIYSNYEYPGEGDTVHMAQTTPS